MLKKRNILNQSSPFSLPLTILIGAQGVLWILAPLTCLSPVKPSKDSRRGSKGTNGGNSAGLTPAVGPHSQNHHGQLVRFSHKVPSQVGQVGTEVQPTIPSPAQYPGAWLQSPTGRVLLLIGTAWLYHSPP